MPAASVCNDDYHCNMSMNLKIIGGNKVECSYYSTDLLTARGVAHLVVHVTSGSTSYETIPPVPSETSGGVLSTVDTVVQRRDGPRRLRDNDVEDEQTKLHAIRASC